MAKGSGATRGSSNSKIRSTRVVSEPAQKRGEINLPASLASGKLKRDSYSNETWYEGIINEQRVRILEENVGNTSWWNLEVDNELIRNADNRAMSFSSPNDAYSELKSVSSGKGTVKIKDKTFRASYINGVPTFSISMYDTQERISKLGKYAASNGYKIKYTK